MTEPNSPAVCGPLDAPVGRLDDGMPADAVRFVAGVYLPHGVMFDVLGKPRTRYVRVSLDGSHCVMRPSEGDSYLQDARDCGDNSEYTVADVYLSEREFEGLPEHVGF